MKYNYDFDLAVASRQYVKIITAAPVRTLDVNPPRQIVVDISRETGWSEAKTCERLTIMLKNGCHISKGQSSCSWEELNSQLFRIVEKDHDNWVLKKVAEGYIYGDKVNHDSKKGQLTHTNILPFSILWHTKAEEFDWIFRLIYETVDAILDAGYNILVEPYD